MSLLHHSFEVLGSAVPLVAAWLRGFLRHLVNPHRTEPIDRPDSLRVREVDLDGPSRTW